MQNKPSFLGCFEFVTNKNQKAQSKTLYFEKDKEDQLIEISKTEHDKKFNRNIDNIETER